MSIPSPADLAARRPAPKPTPPPARTIPVAAAPRAEAQPPASPANPLEPGRLTKKEHFRKFFLFGMRLSRMHPHARLVGYDLMWRASHATGRLSPSLQPSRGDLASATGLSRGQVDVALNTLHSRGWIHYRRLQEGPRAGAQAMSLAIPAAVLEQIRTHTTGKPSDGYSH